MKTLLLLILGATLCLGESCYWIEQADRELKIEEAITRTEVYPVFKEKKKHDAGYTVTYFCIDGNVFVGVGHNDYGRKEMPATNITQVIRNMEYTADTRAVKCKCEKE